MQAIVGSRVVATCQITEGGGSGDSNAKFPEPTYIHAEKNDRGTVETIDDGCYTVRFDRTGTATIVGETEIDPV